MQHVVFNQKGGVGKSTITCNLAAISAWQGKRTLVIDLDSQGNSTRYLLGADMPEDLPNVAEFFEQSLKFTIRDKGAKEFIVNQFQARANLPQRMVQELIDEGLPVLQPYLRSSVRIRESHELSMPMIFLDPSHTLTQEFVALHDVIVG